MFLFICSYSLFLLHILRLFAAHKVIKDLKPTCSYVWEDAAGIHAHLQGSTVELGALAGASLGAGIMMPALARTRQ